MKKKRIVVEIKDSQLKSNKKFNKYYFSVSVLNTFYYNQIPDKKGFFDKLKDKFSQKKDKKQEEKVEDISLPSNIERYNPTASEGLTKEQVEER